MLSTWKQLFLNFFGSFQDIDPWGTGVLRPDSIPTALSIAVELTEVSLNPERYPIDLL